MTRYRPWLIALLLLAPLVALWAAPGELDCVVRHLLGVDCPGCGLGRGLAALGQGELGSALLHYPPLPALALGYVAALAALLPAGRWARVGRIDWNRMASFCGATIAVAVMGNWLARLL